MNERVEEFVVEGLVLGVAGEHCVEVCVAHGHGLREEIMVASSGVITMSVDGSENPMMNVP